MQYPATTAITIPTGRNNYAYGGGYGGSYGSHMQPLQYGGYPQSMPMYGQQQVVYAMPGGGYGMPASYGVQNYGGYGMQMPSQYMPGMGMGGSSVIVQDPYYRRRSSRRRRHSYSYGYRY